MYVKYNPNPMAARVGDCVIRAVSKLIGCSWEEAYLDLCVYGLMCCDLPSANAVWGRYLHDKGYTRRLIGDYRHFSYTVKDFTDDHKKGAYLLALNGHVVTVIDGNYYDTWDSGDEIPVYYWAKGE